MATARDDESSSDNNFRYLTFANHFDCVPSRNGRNNIRELISRTERKWTHVFFFLSGTKRNSRVARNARVTQRSLIGRSPTWSALCARLTIAILTHALPAKQTSRDSLATISIVRLSIRRTSCCHETSKPKCTCARREFCGYRSGIRPPLSSIFYRLDSAPRVSGRRCLVEGSRLLVVRFHFQTSTFTSRWGMTFAIKSATAAVPAEIYSPASSELGETS